MSKVFRDSVLRFRFDESGATLVEYGIALLLAIGVSAVALTSLAENTEVNYQDTQDRVVYR